MSALPEYIGGLDFGFGLELKLKRDERVPGARQLYCLKFDAPVVVMLF